MIDVDSSISYHRDWLNLFKLLVASMIAWLPKSGGNKSLTAACTSLEERVFFLVYLTNLEASTAICSNMSVTRELTTAIPFLEIPTSVAMDLSTL